MNLVPGGIVSPIAGHILCPGAPLQVLLPAFQATPFRALAQRPEPMGGLIEIAYRYGGVGCWEEVPIHRVSLDLDTDLGPTVALRWLGRHYALPLGVGCPEWIHHADEHGGWYRLRGFSGEVVFFSAGHPASSSTKAGAKWVTLPTVPSSSLEALAAACVHVARETSESGIKFL